MAKLLTLGDLQQHFEQAREKLSLDRQEILSAHPLAENFSRDEYGFAYMRAERVGMEAITESLKEIAWLPMQLDPQSEILSENRGPMKRWLGGSGGPQPDGTIFGNDFIHALTRTAIAQGWDSAGLRALALRVGELFHDLSCLIGLIYYGVWMSENGIEGLPVSDPDDLERTAQEIATLTRSPEVAQLLKKRREVEGRVREEDAPAAVAAPRKKGRPVLRVIENTNYEPEPIGY